MDEVRKKEAMKFRVYGSDEKIEASLDLSVTNGYSKAGLRTTKAGCEEKEYLW